MGHAITFYFFGTLAVVLSLAVILHRNIFKSATLLAGMLFCIAALFIALDAEFLAVVQVLIYIGAITVLIVFAIMLTTKINDPMRTQFNNQRLVAPVAALGVLGLIISFVLQGRWISEGAELLPQDLLGEIGKALVSKFILPFDMVSVLLLVALVGAMYIAKHEDRPAVPDQTNSDSESGHNEMERVDKISV
jgi:NADH:ubiquinone oxidoreductase subunit 6 (subunit J)